MKNRFIQKCGFKRGILFTVIAILASLSTLGLYAESKWQNYFALINDNKVYLEVADNDIAVMMGLMNRDSLADNTGMIFLFKKSGEVAFWMKNMRFPLDMLFISGNKIVKIYENVPICSIDKCEIYPSQYKVDYVIELNAGFCSKNNVKIGQNVILSSNIIKRYDKLRSKMGIIHLKPIKI